MPAVGTTGDLYAERDNPTSTLGAPPAPPSDVPPPTKVAVVAPVTTKARMADERPDGSIRDTSTEALRPGNDLNFRNITDEEQTKPAPEPPAETKPPEPPKEAPKETPPAPTPEKIYAGKFKSAEDLEKSYRELERKLTETSQAKANLEREKLAAPPASVATTPEQLAAEQSEANRILGEFASNPKKFLDERDRKVQETTMVALTAQQIAADWRKNNPDLAEHEIRVAFEATLLAQSDPELARNHEALLSKATDNFRQFTGKIRTEGAKEALTQESRTIPLLSGTAQTPATEQPANKAPLTADEAYSLHLQMLKKEEQRTHRGLRR